ncbi:WD40/YVTN/BNR-like repeat-containing protein [Microbacterium schleiferi]|nr:hypothetical protein [Microbacterium schleiferi]
MRTYLRAANTGLALSGLLLLAGCATAEPPSTGIVHAAPAAHVHAIVSNPEGDGFLLGTHDGIFAASAEGKLLSRVGGYGFDAMGLTLLGEDLIASGHPGSNTPAELGDQNLGIIRSTDAGESWEAVTFTGEKDFHALTASSDGTVYGLATDAIDLLASTDMGDSWSPTGGQLMAVGLVATSGGGLVAATPDGLQVSTDGARSFRPWSDAPMLYALSASPNRELIVGVDAKERIWVHTVGTRGWAEAGTVHGAAQATAITDTGKILVADDSGLTLLPAEQ